MAKRGSGGMPLQPSTLVHTSTTSRKRQRSSGAPPTNGTEAMIEIPGVPTHVTPILVQTLRVATRFFQHATTSAVEPYVEDDERDDTVFSLQNNQSQPKDGAVVESIMSRIEAFTAADQVEKQRQRKSRMDQGIKELMESIRQEVRNERSRSNNEINEAPRARRISVPVACLVYICNLCMTHVRVSVRRAALRTCGVLLTKSSDCRAHMAQDGEMLLEWIESIVGAPQFDGWKNPNDASVQIPLLQQEGMDWITLLAERFALHYPKLRVSQRYMSQHCPNLRQAQQETQATTTITTSHTPGELRDLRDLALKHGNEECQRVQRLVQKAQSYLDVLVPRFGHDSPATIAEPENTASDDESDVDWEEGDLVGAEEENQGADSDDITHSHEAAVERTLALMDHAGGLLESGTVEIDFNKQAQESQLQGEQQLGQGGNNVRQKLQKIVDRLSRRHMPRLSSWVDALIRADGLTLHGGALVLLATEVSRQRRVLLQSLLDAKSNVTSILLSASRLSVRGMDSSEQSNSENHSALNIRPRPSGAAQTRIGERSRASSRAAQRSKQSVARQRSNRVQIKYRTS